LFGLFAIPSFLLFNTQQTVWILISLVVALGIIHPLMEGTLSSFWAELFDSRVRYSGLSFNYQFSGIFASGLTPLIATALLSLGGGEPWLFGTYMVTMALVSVASIYGLEETYRKDIFQTKIETPEWPEPEPAIKV
jgi:MFS family permease